MVVTLRRSVCQRPSELGFLGVEKSDNHRQAIPAQGSNEHLSPCPSLGLFAKRRRNLRAVLERIVERVDEVEVNAAAVISAAQALAKINIQGQWVERTEQVNLNELIERMSKQELEAYAREGALPEWFARTVGATVKDSANGKYDE
jgi:hypothetical protein